MTIHKMAWVEKADDLLIVNSLFYCNTIIEENEILRWFDLCDAFWIHDNDPKKPHAELTSGKCSNGFFDCMKVLKYPNICEILANQFFLRFREIIDKNSVDWVIGSPYAGITFSYEIAKRFNVKHGFPEKDPSDPKGKKMVWRRELIPEGARILQVEELVTTSGTFQEVKRAIEEAHSYKLEFLSEVFVLVHRPAKLPADYGDRKVFALIEREIWSAEPSKCHLCKAGSSRLRPKTHWQELTGRK